MPSDHENPQEPGPLTSPGRRNAVRTLAGAGAAVMVLAGRGHASSAPAVNEFEGPTGPESLQVAATRIKKGKRGPTGPTGPGGGSLSQNRATNSIPDGSNANAQANCLTGQATGGGASISNTNCELVSSNVVGTIAWSATGRCPVGATAMLTVQVICLG